MNGVSIGDAHFTNSCINMDAITNITVKKEAQIHGCLCVRLVGCVTRIKQCEHSVDYLSFFTLQVAPPKQEWSFVSFVLEKRSHGRGLDFLTLQGVDLIVATRRIVPKETSSRP